MKLPKILMKYPNEKSKKWFMKASQHIMKYSNEKYEK